MECPKINYRNFDPNRVLKYAPEQKTSKPKEADQAPITYYEMPVQYEYDVTDADGTVRKVVAPLYVEGPELYTPVGITTKQQPSGQDTASIFCQFDMTNPDVRGFVLHGDCAKEGEKAGFFHQLYLTFLSRVFEARAQCGMAKNNKIEMIEGVFSYHIFWPRDQTTGQIIDGKNPSKYFNLLNQGRVGSATRKECLLTSPVPLELNDPDSTTWEWEQLKNVEMKFQPLLLIKKVYIGGGKASIQIEMTSAVVTYVVAANSVSNQRDTMDRIRQNEQVVSNLKDQIDRLLRRGKPETREATRPQEGTPAQEPVKASPPSPSPKAEPAQPAPQNLASMLGSGPTITPIAGLPAAFANIRVNQ